MQPQLQIGTRSTQAALASHKVLRNTYMLLGLSLIPTIIGAFIGMSLNFSFLARSPFIGALAMVAIMFGMFWAINKNKDSGLGVVLLLGLTLFMGVMLGPILQYAGSLQNGGTMVAIAAGGTAVIFFTLAGIVTVTRRDFSFMGKFLIVGAVLLLVAMLANAFFQIPAMALTLSAIAILIFSGFILYDVSRIVHGGETNYVMATLALYLDIYNIFVNLLHLLLAFTGRE